MDAPQILQGLDARYRAGRRYQLVAPFVYASAIPGVGTIVVPAGFVTNFHSSPRALWWLFPPDDWAEAAVAHDHLYVTGLVSRLQADQVHRELLRHLGASAPRASAMYAGLRLGGWRAWNRYRRGGSDV
jgi:hypothetical protein